MDYSANVCVISADTAQILFPISNPIGKEVRVGGTYYRVIGILNPKKQLKVQQMLLLKKPPFIDIYPVEYCSRKVRRKHC
jgi:hypothetical protein